MTWKEIISSPTTMGGVAASVGLAVVGVAVAYSLPKAVLVTSALVAAVGSAIAHFGSADNKDLPPPPPPAQ